VLKERWATEDQLKVFPFIVNSRFENQLSDEQKLHMKENLNMDISKKTILLLGGGDGMPGAMNILRSMVELQADVNVVVVCGRDEGLRNTILAEKFDASFASLNVFGFIGFVYELINVADVVVTKCGPNTIMEILMCGKIPIVNSYIWEQEKGNLEFVVNNGLGIYEPSPKKIGSAALRFIKNDSVMLQYKERVQKMQIINGTRSVSEYIFNAS
jgi:processive 1,2-diacylglycerol beta-glucosyltransferase/1,2-diacylglycerol 3-beta-galactosyltransferase